MGALGTIQLLVAPVVMISAGGLLCLALYNRLATIISRARTFNKERFDMRGRLSAHPGPADLQQSVRLQLQERLAVLEQQVFHTLSRARLIRGALRLMLTMVLCMLVCSLCLAGSLVSAIFARFALAAFLLGVVAMIAAVTFALAELNRALDPVMLEHIEMTQNPENGEDETL